MSGVPGILLCDDSPKIRELVRVVLELEGKTVVAEAENGRDAVAAAERHQPDVVLLDLSMPVMDGLEALPEIRRVAPDARVVVLSGFENPALVSAALSLGAERYVTKGGDPAEIVAAVEGGPSG
ncbi:MAG TPA: response regulator transcription factor [Gaiellaceae bacterium]|nr:response regulator transcription factor [Gaiellaceae bacterium]